MNIKKYKDFYLIKDTKPLDYRDLLVDKSDCYVYEESFINSESAILNSQTSNIKLLFRVYQYKEILELEKLIVRLEIIKDKNYLINVVTKASNLLPSIKELNRNSASDANYWSYTRNKYYEDENFIPFDGLVTFPFFFLDETMDNPYLEKLLEDKLIDLEIDSFYSSDSETAIKSIEARKELVPEFSWAIPNNAALSTINRYSPIVEIGAGTGYWAYCLSQLGCDIIAYDKTPYINDWCKGQWFDVEKADNSIIKEHSDRALLLIWPPYNTSMAYETLGLYKGDTFIYIGEGFGGCTGTDSFFELLDKEWTLIEEVYIPRWWGIRDSMYVYIKDLARQ